MANLWRDLLRDGLRSVLGTNRSSSTPRTRGPQRPTISPQPTTTRPTNLPRPGDHVAHPDFEGRLTPVYTPHLDGDADPGEVVWTWVPFEDDPSQGKDRPVLVVGRDGYFLLGLMLTSKDHDRNAEKEARHGRHWMDIGSGDWDAQRRPSEIRLDRVLTVDPLRVRREGSIMPRAMFDQVVESLAELKGW